jgi:hypothetical protein
VSSTRARYVSALRLLLHGSTALERLRLVMSSLEVGEQAYRRAMSRITTAGAPVATNAGAATTPDEGTVRSWLAGGGSCLRIRPVRRVTNQVPSTFRVLLDGSQVLLANPSHSAVLLNAGEHAVASVTRSQLGRYFAVVDLTAGEDVELRFRSGLIDAQTGGGWVGLSSH